MEEATIISIIGENFKDLRKRLDLLDTKLDTLVTKESCGLTRQNCTRVTSVQQSEINIKKIAAISTAITGVITVSGGLIISIIKLI